MSNIVNILAIETTFGQASVAVSFVDAQCQPRVISRQLAKGDAQAEKIVPLIGAVMQEAGLDFFALDRIAVCIGPGTFSGVRTGVAAARGVALAASVPVIGVTSMALMAHDVLAFFQRDARRAEPFGLVAPAGSGLFYGQTFAADVTSTSDVRVFAPDDALDFLKGKATLLFGPGATELVKHAQACAFDLPEIEIIPNAITLCALAPTLDAAHHEATPFYVRPPDAKPQMSYVIERVSE